MKIERVSESIWSLKTWMIIPIHVWVVVDGAELTLVDSGMPFMAKGILKFIDGLHTGPLKRILLTHGHPDHVGSVTKIIDSKSVPIFAHQLEIPYIAGELPYPGRKKAKPNLAKGLAQPLSEDQAENLKDVAGLTPYLTPGHSPGHVVYFHKRDEILLAGDLFSSKNGRLHKPMFTPNMVDTLKSSLIVSELKPKRVEVCHGDPVFNPAEQLDEYIRTTSSSLSLSHS